jgi:general secretion pathway protein L
MKVGLERTLQTLRVRYIAPLERGFHRFWSWWIAELIEILPQDLREAIAQRKQRLFVELDGADVVIRQGINGQTREVMRCALDAPDDTEKALPQDSRDTVLLLPEHSVLTKPLTLPLAAEENLREVLAFEMDQETPFSADQLYYDFAITDRASEQQTLSLDLVYAPRALVDELLDSLSHHGVEPDVLTCLGGAGDEPRPVNLLPASKRQNKRKVIRRSNIALASLALLLLVTAISLPIIQKRQVIQDLEPQVQKATSEATAGNQLRQDVEKLAEGSAFLVQKKQKNLLVVQVINEVSRVLPDHTWIYRFDLAGDEIQLQGQSTSAAALIALVESSPLLHNARFRSSVIQDPRTNAERFHLSAEVNWEQVQ